MSVHTLSVAKRLGIIVGAGILASVLTGAFSLVQMGKLNASEDALATNALPSLITINELNDDANNLRERELNYVISDNAEQIAPEEADAIKLRQKINENLATYAKWVDNDAERELLSKLKQQLGAYLAEHDKTLAGAKGSLGAGSAALDAQVREVSGRAFDALGERIDALVEFNMRAVAEDHHESQATYEQARLWLTAMLIAALVLSSVLAAWIARGLLRQLGGEPVRAAGIAARIADGDLTVAIDIRDGDTSSLMYATRSMRDKLVQIVGEVRTGTDAVATASGQIALGNRDLSSRTEEQASSLEETAASMEELTSTVKQNADNARQANQLANTASDIAVRGGEVVLEMVQTMDEINAASKQIVDIISVIDGIAFQTNILALNAAVEAARAGEQGRGFAVVASEVRSLAQRSAAAAKEIKVLINASVEKVEIGTKLVGHAGSTMSDVVESVKRVTDLMSEISAASDEQRHGIEQVNSAITQMDQATQQNATLVEEATAAADSMQQQAANLMELVDVFKLDMVSTRSPSKPAGIEPAFQTRPSRRAGFPRLAANV